MKLKIISDGSTAGTKIIDVESGEALGYVQMIQISAMVGEPTVEAIVYMAGIPLEMVVDAKMDVLPDGLQDLLSGIELEEEHEGTWAQVEVQDKTAQVVPAKDEVNE